MSSRFWLTADLGAFFREIFWNAGFFKKTLFILILLLNYSYLDTGYPSNTLWEISPVF